MVRNNYAIIISTLPLSLQAVRFAPAFNLRYHVITGSEYRSYQLRWYEDRAVMDLSGFCIQSRGLSAPRHRALIDTSTGLEASRDASGHVVTLGGGETAYRWYDSRIDTDPESAGYKALANPDCRTLDAARTEPTLLSLIADGHTRLMRRDPIGPFRHPRMWAAIAEAPDINVEFIERRALGVLRGTETIQAQLANVAGQVVELTEDEIGIKPVGGEEDDIRYQPRVEGFKWSVEVGDFISAGSEVLSPESRMTNIATPSQAAKVAPKLFSAVCDSVFEDGMERDGVQQFYSADLLKFPIRCEFRWFVRPQDVVGRTAGVPTSSALRGTYYTSGASLMMRWDFMRLPPIFRKPRQPDVVVVQPQKKVAAPVKVTSSELVAV